MLEEAKSKGLDGVATTGTKAELGQPNAGKRAYQSIGRHDQGGFASRDEWLRMELSCG